MVISQTRKSRKGDFLKNKPLITVNVKLFLSYKWELFCICFRAVYAKHADLNFSVLASVKTIYVILY